jgi:eukaryotic-like serine/threonine-protein kinase
VDGPDSNPDSNAPAHAAGDWFSSEDLLLGELRRVRADRAAPPEIPGYDDLREIRRGGQGVVFSAVQRSTKRKVAIKVMLAGELASPAARRRFEREIDLAASLRHPGIVRVYDSGVTSAGLPYLVMEFVEGVAISEFLRGTSADSLPPPKLVLSLFEKIARALTHAHQRGVLHRDLKPSNIRVDAAGEPRLLDFGLAKAIGVHADATAVSTSGQFVGSLPWASPEQVSGEPDAIDARTDIYSLGVMLYRELTGRFPYTVEGNIREVIDAILSADPPPPRSLMKLAPLAGVNAGSSTGTSTVTNTANLKLISEDCQTVVLKCLAKDPARRYQSAADLADDLSAVLTGAPVRARADSTWYVLSRRVRRYRAVAAAGAVVAVIAVAALAATLVFWNRAASARDQAVVARDEARSQAAQRAESVAFLERMLTAANPGRDGRNVKVVDVLRRAAAELDAGGSGTDPAVEAAARAAVGGTYAALGLRTEARRHLSRALELRKASLSPGHDDVLSLQMLLIQLQSRDGDSVQALASIDEALAAAAREQGPESAAALRMRSVRAEVLFNSNKLDEAVKELTATLDAQRRLLGAAHIDTVTTMTGLGVVLRQTGKSAEAEKLYREAISVSQLPENSPKRLDLDSNLIQAIHDQNRLQDADPLYRDLIARQSRVLGEDHPATLVSRSNYATLLIDLGRLDGPDGAEALIRSTHAALSRTLGPDRVETLLALNNLAKVVQDQGRLEESLPLWQSCYESFKRTLGPAHRSTLIAGGNLGVVYSELKRHDESVALQREIVAEQTKSLGPDHISTLISTNNLARTLEAMGKREEALVYSETAARGAQRALAEGHLTTGILRGNYARCLAGLGRYEEALPEIRASVAIIIASLGDADARSRQALMSLAEICEKLGHSEEAAAARARLPAPADGK